MCKEEGFGEYVTDVRNQLPKAYSKSVHTRRGYASMQNISEIEVRRGNRMKIFMLLLMLSLSASLISCDSHQHAYPEWDKPQEEQN